MHFRTLVHAATRGGQAGVATIASSERTPPARSRVFQPLLVLALAASPWTAIAAQHEGTDEIARVVDRFKHAIVDKDEPAFLDLFLHGGITWQSAMSDAVFERAKDEDPNATRAAYQPDRSPARFIRGIAGRAARTEETFHDVRIDTDGTVASVAFDFTFQRDGETSNKGREYWLLVRTDAGWKIASVVWSDN